MLHLNRRIVTQASNTRDVGGSNRETRREALTDTRDASSTGFETLSETLTTAPEHSLAALPAIQKVIICLCT